MKNEKATFYRKIIDALLGEAGTEQLKVIYAFIAAYIG